MSDRWFFAAFAAAMFVIAAMLLVTAWLARQPVPCDHVVAVPYKAGERPICVLVRRVKA